MVSLRCGGRELFPGPGPEGLAAGGGGRSRTNRGRSSVFKIVFLRVALNQFQLLVVNLVLELDDLAQILMQLRVRDLAWILHSRPTLTRPLFLSVERSAAKHNRYQYDYESCGFSSFLILFKSYSFDINLPIASVVRADARDKSGGF